MLEYIQNKEINIEVLSNFNFKVPNDILKFYNYCNSGKFVSDNPDFHFVFNNNGDELSFRGFLKSSIGSSNDIQETYKTIFPEWISDEYRHVYTEFVPFAFGYVNDYYCYNNKNNKIIYIDLQDDNEDMLLGNFVVANSFTEFLEKLISQNGGYIKNLSEILEQIKKD